MEQSEYGLMFGVEDSHWWYRGMAEIACALLDRWYPRGGSLRILDAGCGTGAAMTGFLARYGRVWGIDISAQALRFCRRRGAARLARATVATLPFPDGFFGLAASFDVLYGEAVPSDLEAVREIRRVLAPGGRLFVRLPAYGWMRRGHDTVIRTKHRYTRGEVAALLRHGGFRVERTSYANTFLFPAAVVRKAGEALFRAAPRSDLSWKPGPFNAVLARILSAEAGWIARTGLPFGLSVIGAGSKP
ncbi:MAG: class I SAM-dependent methyltransferase [Anaerolineales bacterium]|nr:class I SAM-dependent methyltransferase [Anaerolineales bacterium]